MKTQSFNGWLFVLSERRGMGKALVVFLAVVWVDCYQIWFLDLLNAWKLKFVSYYASVVIICAYCWFFNRLQQKFLSQSQTIAQIWLISLWYQILIFDLLAHGFTVIMEWNKWSGGFNGILKPTVFLLDFWTDYLVAVFVQRFWTHVLFGSVTANGNDFTILNFKKFLKHFGIFLVDYLKFF